jgi:octaprenyl-diphosphate synthase
MKLKSIYKPISKDLEKVKQGLNNVLQSKDSFLQRLNDHLLSLKGKLFRPALVLFSAKLNGQSQKEALYLAQTVELIHLATLLHDDIIDGANLRRRKKTVNSLFGNKLSLLMGDYLYAQASDLISELNIPQAIYKKLALATKAMCTGEIKEFSNENKPNLIEEEYFSIIEQKTASFISVCCDIGAVLSGLTGKQIKALSLYGKYLGLAFQVADDCLDFSGQKDLLGKTPGIDFLKGRLTLPLILFFKNSSSKEKKVLKQLFAGKNNGGGNFQKARKIILESKYLDQSYQKAEEFSLLAKKQLESINDSAYKQGLLELADYVVNRDS